MKNIGLKWLATLLFLSIAPSAFAQTVPASMAQIQLSFAPLVKQVAPAVVNIYTRRVVQNQLSPLFADPFFRRFFGDAMPEGFNRDRVESSLGSGVIVDAAGLVVTSAHVVRGADEITVVLADRREFQASVALSDERTDLALLRLKNPPSDLTVMSLRDSDTVEVGELVLALGNPFGVGQTVTMGLVSAVARAAEGVSDYGFFIQTDAAINPGNSGGALITMDGKLVGINSAIYSRDGGSLGIGFAVPSNMVRRVLQAGASGNKSLVRAWSGIAVQPLTAELAKAFGLSRPLGVLVKDLHPQSPAMAAGLQSGDIITAIDGQDIDAPAAFQFRLGTLSPGQVAQLTVWRKGQVQTIALPLIAPPEIPARDVARLSGEQPLAGADVANLNPALAEELQRDNHETGVIILQVARNSPAAQVGLRAGDIVLRLNGQNIASVALLKAALPRQNAPWQIEIRRNGKVLSVMVGKGR